MARAHGAMAEPLAALDAFTRAGTRWIHLVDMDRAYGRPDNHELIGAVLKAASVRVQVGGGLFREIDIDQMFTLGATRVVIGPRGALDSGLVERGGGGARRTFSTCRPASSRGGWRSSESARSSTTKSHATGS